MGKSATLPCGKKLFSEKLNASICWAITMPSFQRRRRLSLTRRTTPNTSSSFYLPTHCFANFKKLQISQQKDLASQAKPLLLGLYETNYKDKVLLPLAEVHRLLEENAQAAALYAVLAETMPDKKEEFCSQAASLQMGFSKNDAIATFQKVLI